MKPFLGTDLTTDKHNEQMNGNEFLIQTPSAALLSTLWASLGQAKDAAEQAKIPPLFRVVRTVCGFTALMILLGMLKANVSFEEGYGNAPYLYWIGGIGGILWLILWIWGKRKNKTVKETDENAQIFSHLESVVGAIYNELSVPDTAKNVDIMRFFYKTKDGTVKVHGKGLQLVQYFNPEFKLFADDKNLYLVNLEGKYAFPLSAIVKTHTVKKRFYIAGWNKPEKFNKGIYKQYKLATDKYGFIHCRYYHILELRHQGETFGIYFPCYELPAFEECTK